MFEYEKNDVDDDFYQSYIIEKGDTLYEISKNFDVNTKLLAEINGLDLNEYIYPGQILLVPKKNVSYYITKDGDTLETVAEVFGVNIDNIIKQNKTIYLLEGQMINLKK